MNTTPQRDRRFDGQAAVTRSLLGWGVVAGAFYLVVGVVLGLTREGFDFGRHQLSLLMLGDYGWMQTANLIVSGLMVIAATVGFARAMRGAGGMNRAGILVGAYGVCLVAGGIFPPDPTAGLPEGTPAGSVSASGLLHLAFGGIGFLSLAAAAFVVAAWYARRRETTTALVSRIAGAVIVVGFVGGAMLSTRTLGVIFLWIAVVVGWGWLAAASVQLYRIVPHPDPHRRHAEA